MSSVFSEVYGTYYNIVAKLLAQASKGELSSAKLQQLISAEGYGDSLLQLLPALKDGTWKLLTPDLHTPLKHQPTLPLTLLQKRWLKTLLQDERLSLFFTNEELAKQEQALQNVEPLYKPGQFVFFDRYIDGDDYNNPRYRETFRQLLQALREKRYLNASYRSNRGTIIVWTNLLPLSMEYSAKDDKFRLQAMAATKQVTLNVSRIIAAETGDIFEGQATVVDYAFNQQKLVMEIEDVRSTMVRALLHFSDLAKETEKLDATHYRLTVFYDKGDETELVFRVLSFGPMLKVIEPQSFIELIREKLQKQLSAQLFFHD